MRPELLEAEEIRAAKAGNDCSAVDKVFLRVNLSAEDRAFVENCWDVRQSEIVPRAMSSNDCRAVITLPGMYPRGTDEEKRFVYHCWMRLTGRDLDSCIGMIEVGDRTSLPLILRVLGRNEPVRHPSGGMSLIDTAGACLEALQRIESLDEPALRKRAATWSRAWRRWAELPEPWLPAAPVEWR